MDIVELTQPKASVSQNNPPLRELVKRALQNYFTQLDGQSASNLYDLVMAEVEAPLLEETLKYTQNGHSNRNNQSKAAEVLGLSRGTLRKKLQEYDLL